MTDLSDDAIDRLRSVAGWPELATERYTILGELGRGGMGTVYAALDTELGREVALKISNVVSSAVVERSVASEARVLASLEHPGIVPVHDAGRLVDGRPFYVMKRVVGRTLTQELQQAGDLGERLRVFERICETMAFAHARGILHRDLKPDNVMIGPFGEVMVLDWGVAHALESPGGEPSAPPTIYGTHGFMSPEQARGEKVDARTDVYALGAILRTMASTAGQSVPKPLTSICAKAMAGPAGERYPSVAELRADVARFRASQAVEAHRETFLERSARFGRVYRTAILLVLAYIVMRALVAFSTRF
jgi:serine/threonine protein kinase